MRLRLLMCSSRVQSMLLVASAADVAAKLKLLLLLKFASQCGSSDCGVDFMLWQLAFWVSSADTVGRRNR
jgi:heme/copper-type cytochrome/quinol oxidase subunit 1